VRLLDDTVSLVDIYEVLLFVVVVVDEDKVGLTKFGFTLHIFPFPKKPGRH